MAEPLPDTDFGGILALMARSDVECILIGGLAAAVHGSAHITYDIDFCYRRTRDNIERLVATLAPYSPYLRGAPPGLPFEWSTATVQRGLNFTLITSLGAIDLLGEVSGGGTYDEILPHTEVVALFGTELRCASLPMLIRMKRAAGRPKDLDMLAGLEALQEERRASDRG
jgi:hypothetical protein